MKSNQYFPHKIQREFLAPYGVVRVAHGAFIDLYHEHHQIAGPLSKGALHMAIESAPYQVADVASKLGVWIDINQHGEIWITAEDDNDGETVYIDGCKLDADGLTKEIRSAVCRVLMVDA